MIKVQTSHFGEVEIDDSKVLMFENGLPGLEGDKRFALLSNEDSKPINWLQSLDRKEISLPVLDPFLVCKDYSFDLSNNDISALGIKRVKDVYVLCVLVIPRSLNLMTINLSAPIIINVENSKGCQIILDDRKYRVRTPITELTGKQLGGGA
jgi:flagellar assembly factor FliW